MNITVVTTIDLGALNGPSVHAINVANGLCERGHGVTMIAPRPSMATAVALDPRIVRLETPDLRRFRVPGSLSLLAALPKIWRQRQSDVLIIRASPTSLIATAVARMAGARSILVEANGWISDELIALGKGRIMVACADQFQLWEGKLADSVRCVTAGLRDRYVRSGVPAGRVAHIDNGTDLETFRPLDFAGARLACGYNADEVVLTYLGNLWPAVDLETVLSAVTRPEWSSRRVRLVVIGDGIDRPRLEALGALAVQASPDFHIDWVGAKNQIDANRLLSACNVALAPFRKARNGSIGLSPLKLRDYAAAGCPTVASRIDGITAGPDWLWLADPEDPAALSTALIAALSADRQLSSRAARLQAEAHFGWGNVVTKIEALVSGFWESKQ